MRSAPRISAAVGQPGQFPRFVAERETKTAWRTSWAFGNAGVTVALATGGGHFAAPTLRLERRALNFAGGWSSENQFPRAVADVNGRRQGRHRSAFGIAGVTVALATEERQLCRAVFTLGAFGPRNSAVDCQPGSVPAFCRST